MISYQPLWDTMKKKKITRYAMLHKYHFSNGTYSRLKAGQPMTTSTLDSLCKVLQCRVEDILLYVEDNE